MIDTAVGFAEIPIAPHIVFAFDDVAGDVEGEEIFSSGNARCARADNAIFGGVIKCGQDLPSEIERIAPSQLPKHGGGAVSHLFKLFSKFHVDWLE